MRISELMSRVYNGEVVIPEFQRSFIWEPEDIRELLVSVIGGYHIGTMLVIRLSTEDSPFRLRLIEGVREVNNDARIATTVTVILDGQQRTTALFYALHGPDLPLKGRKNPYRFYLDLGKALAGDWNDAVIAAVSANRRRIQNDYIIPFTLLFQRGYFDIGSLTQKIYNMRFDNEALGKIINLVNNFVNREIYTIEPPQVSVDLEWIAETFERINRTGVPLSIFELLTARLYKYNIKLRDMLEDAKSKYEFARIIPEEYILKVVALIRNLELKRRNLLELAPQNFESDWRTACDYLNKAYNRMKNDYGIINFNKWAPYTTMIVPLAGILYYCSKVHPQRHNAMPDYEKIDKWYWISVFDNRYDQAVDTTSHQDYINMQNWFNDNNNVPEALRKFDIRTVEIDTDKQSSAIYRGIMNLVILKGALDFHSGQRPHFEPDKVEDDHIFPKSVYGESRIANRTLIADNRHKINKKPSEYFGEKLNLLGEDRLVQILESHLIPRDALSDLLNDNIQSFMDKRKNTILAEIKRRTAI
ncbi:MAG: DUF262 domain-containing protein [candidate division WOR-3 bacterium]